MAEKFVEKLISWIPNIFSAFKPFSPEIQKLQINYREKTSEIYYKLDLGNENFRRKLAKIKIPNSGNYSIKAFFDEGFTDYMRIIQIDRNSQSYIINPKELPSSRFFIVIMKGMIDPDGLKRIVYVQPAANRNNTQNLDRYWLQASIRDIRIMERIYSALEVDEVNCNVNIAIDKYFSADIPRELKETAESFQKFIIAGQERDRNKLYLAWRRYYKSIHSKNSVLETFYENIFNKVKLREYIKVDGPFKLGKIGPHKMELYLPVSFKTEAITKLTLDEPFAKGFLSFHKKKFSNVIKKEITENNHENRRN